jgi:hypothetical protein
MTWRSGRPRPGRHSWFAKPSQVCYPMPADVNGGKSGWRNRQTR